MSPHRGWPWFQRLVGWARRELRYKERRPSRAVSLELSAYGFSLRGKGRGVPGVEGHLQGSRRAWYFIVSFRASPGALRLHGATCCVAPYAESPMLQRVWGRGHAAVRPRYVKQYAEVRGVPTASVVGDPRAGGRTAALRLLRGDHTPTPNVPCYRHQCAPHSLSRSKRLERPLIHCGGASCARAIHAR